ncbi:NET1-associated nuclear protein 1 [Elasticomyces elasticus]|nr:NET1-associated nuclear protein 1 [Elasticomyces elasticus]
MSARDISSVGQRKRKRQQKDDAVLPSPDKGLKRAKSEHSSSRAPPSANGAHSKEPLSTVKKGDRLPSANPAARSEKPSSHSDVPPTPDSVASPQKEISSNTSAKTNNDSQENPKEAESLVLPKRKRKEEKKNLLNGSMVMNGVAGDTVLDETSWPVVAPYASANGVLHGSKKRSKIRNEKKSQKRKRPARDAWGLSSMIGGRFLKVDPVFTTDEKYIFGANKREVTIWSTIDSLLHQSIPASENSTVVSFAVARSREDTVFIASADGSVASWNWVEGRETGRYPTLGHHILVLDSATLGSHDTSEVLYALKRKARSQITVLQPEREGHNQAQTKDILDTRKALHSMSVLKDGMYILAIAHDSIFIGTLTDPKHVSYDTLAYTWIEIKVAEPTTCFDTRLTRRGGQMKRKGDAGNHDRLDLVIGNQQGQLYLYEDVLNALSGDKLAADDVAIVEAPPTRILHWHREAVSTAKWSRDGNYIISGGRETVLVLWQLETGKKQFLPHLTAEINKLAVSPSGSSYAVQLADNSIMVLSTSELKPTANFAGLQVQTDFVEDSQSRSEAPPNTNAILPALRRSIAVLHPLRPNLMLLPVSASYSTNLQNTAVAPRPFLQTFDTSAARHIAKQALTRNNMTDFNKGPEGNRIREPDVKFLQISNDGQWLATVDEWEPPINDVTHVSADVHTNGEQRSLRREVHLKIWRWDASSSIWMLETRIDAPHRPSRDQLAGHVYDLVSDPSRTAFATLGEDNQVRIWRPKTQPRNALTARGSNSDGLVEWSCRHAVPLGQGVGAYGQKGSPSKLVKPTDGCLAFSTDGSVLAAAQAFCEGDEGNGIAHFVDNFRGTLTKSTAGLFDGPLAGLGFLGRYFVTLASSLSIWDLVDDTLVHTFSFTEGIPSAPRLRPILALNSDNQTFAIATLSGSRSHVQVFNPLSPEPLWRIDIADTVVAVLPARELRGYVLLTASAEIVTLSPHTSTPLAMTQPVSTPDTQHTVLTLSATDNDDADINARVDTDTDDDGSTIWTSHISNVDLEESESESVKPIVRPEQLLDLFDTGPSFALTDMKNVFSSVVKLYGRKSNWRMVGSRTAGPV